MNARSDEAISRCCVDVFLILGGGRRWSATGVASRYPRGERGLANQRAETLGRKTGDIPD